MYLFSPTETSIIRSTDGDRANDFYRLVRRTSLRFVVCSTASRRNYTQIEFCLLSRDQCVVNLATVSDDFGDEYKRARIASRRANFSIPESLNLLRYALILYS